MIVQKAKGYPIKEKYQKSFSQWDVIVSKRSNVMSKKKESGQNKLKYMIVQKAKGYPIKEKYQKAFSQWDVIMSKRSKRSNDGVKCKALS